MINLIHQSLPQWLQRQGMSSCRICKCLTGRARCEENWSESWHTQIQNHYEVLQLKCRFILWLCCLAIRSKQKYGTICFALDHLFHYTLNVLHFISATACSLFLCIIITVVTPALKFHVKHFPGVSTPTDQLHLTKFSKLDLHICSTFSVLCASSNLSLKHEHNQC